MQSCTSLASWLAHLDLAASSVLAAGNLWHSLESPSLLICWPWCGRLEQGNYHALAAQRPGCVSRLLPRLPVGLHLQACTALLGRRLDESLGVG